MRVIRYWIQTPGVSFITIEEARHLVIWPVLGRKIIQIIPSHRGKGGVRTYFYHGTNLSVMALWKRRNIFQRTGAGKAHMMKIITQMRPFYGLLDSWITFISLISPIGRVAYMVANSLAMNYEDYWGSSKN